MPHLLRSVLAGGRVFPAGTARGGEAAEIIPPGDWWSDGDAAQGRTEAESAAPTEPPRTGRGSSAQAWREYAASRGIEVADGATRDDIITLVDGK